MSKQLVLKEGIQGSGAGGVPVNSLAPFYKLGNDADYHNFIGNDGSEWLRTGVKKPDDGTYSFATKIIELFPTPDTAKLIFEDIPGFTPQGFVGVPSGFIGWSKTQSDKSASAIIDVYWYGHNGESLGTNTTIDMGPGDFGKPWWDNVTKSLWMGIAAPNDSNVLNDSNPLIWYEFNEYGKTGKNFISGGSRHILVMEDNSNGARWAYYDYQLHSVDDPDFLIQTIGMDEKYKYSNSSYRKIRLLRRNDMSVVREIVMMSAYGAYYYDYTGYTTVACTNGQIVVYIRVEGNGGTYRHYEEWVISQDLLSSKKRTIAQSDIVPLIEDFRNGDIIISSTGQYQTVTSVVGMNESKTDSNTGLPLYLKVKDWGEIPADFVPSVPEN